MTDWIALRRLRQARVVRDVRQSWRCPVDGCGGAHSREEHERAELAGEKPQVMRARVVDGVVFEADWRPKAFRPG
jgi:hypothetical protein